MSPSNILVFLLIGIPLVSSSGVYIANYTTTVPIDVILSFKVDTVDPRHPIILKSYNFSVTSEKNVVIEYPLPEFESKFFMSTEVTMTDNNVTQMFDSFDIPEYPTNEWQEMSQPDLMWTIYFIYTCDQGYSGDKCDKQCIPGPRQQCDKDGNVVCDAGLTGKYCDVKVDNNPCQCKNGGLCIPSYKTNRVSEQGTSKRRKCKCPMGYFGHRCQLKNPILNPV